MKNKKINPIMVKFFRFLKEKSVYNNFIYHLKFNYPKITYKTWDGDILRVNSYFVTTCDEIKSYEDIIYLKHADEFITSFFENKLCHKFIQFNDVDISTSSVFTNVYGYGYNTRGATIVCKSIDLDIDWCEISREWKDIKKSIITKTSSLNLKSITINYMSFSNIKNKKKESKEPWYNRYSKPTSYRR